MMTAWRVLKAKHRKAAFTGEGARIYGGRWNPAGVPVVYTAESLSLATLEIIVHLERIDLLRQHFVKIPVTFDDVLVYALPREKLPEDWNRLPPAETTQRIGYEWITQASFPILKVPSTVIPEEHNFLLNPTHPDFQSVSIGEARRFDFDSRLVENMAK